MAGGMDWFRWYHGSANDPKFQLIAKRSAVPVAFVLAVWQCVLERASQEADRGSVGTPDFDTWDCALGMDEGTAARIFGHIEDRGLIVDGRVEAWDRRQPKREREDDSAARVKALRERKKQRAAATPDGDGGEQVTAGNDNSIQHQPVNAGSNHVTPSNATSHQKKPRREESREEEDQHPPNPPRAEGGKVGRERLRGQRIGFKTFLDRCKADGEKPISGYAPMLAYAERVQLPIEFVQLAWDVFREEFGPDGPNSARLQVDWRRHFANYVRKGYYRLWRCRPDGTFELTSQGYQAKNAHSREAA